MLFDGVVVPDGKDAARELSQLGQVREFLMDQYRHCKPILMLGAGSEVIKAAGVPRATTRTGRGFRDLPAFVDALRKHRNWARATDPPRL